MEHSGERGNDVKINWSIRCVASMALAVTIIGTSASAQKPASTPLIRTLTDQEVADLMVGTAIQATRSGNNQVAQAQALLAAGKKFQVISTEDLPDDWNIVMAAGGIGGGDPWQYVVDRVKQMPLPTEKDGTVHAANILSEYMGKKFNAVMRNEADGATFAAFQTSIAMGIPVVDACPTGRAKPEVEQQLTWVNGISITPAALVTRWGDEIIIPKTIDDYRYEDMARAIAVASGGGVSNAKGVLSGADLKRIAIHGAISEAILYGKTVREAKEQGKDPIPLLMKAANAHKMFQGVVASAERSGDRGFTWWNVTVTGTGPYAGHSYKVFVKNENILSWLDGKPDVMSPDLLYNLDPATGEAMTSKQLGSYDVGAPVVFLAKAPESPMWRSPRGIEVIGPRHFGFTFDYVPLETILKARPKFGD